MRTEDVHEMLEGWINDAPDAPTWPELERALREAGLDPLAAAEAALEARGLGV